MNIEPKGVNVKIAVPNLVSLWLNTNYVQGNIIHEGDRRNAVFKCNEDRIGDIAHWDSVSSHFNQDMGDAFYTMMRLYKSKTSLRKIPQTEAREASIQKSTIEGDEFFQDIISGNIIFSAQHLRIATENTVKNQKKGAKRTPVQVGEIYIDPNDLYLGYYIQWSDPNNSESHGLNRGTSWKSVRSMSNYATTFAKNNKVLFGRYQEVSFEDKSKTYFGFLNFQESIKVKPLFSEVTTLAKYKASLCPQL